MITAYLNGSYLPLEQARVSAMDRGFLFGDGIYEVIPVYNGKLFRLPHHLNRLQFSLENIRLPLDLTALQLETVLKTLVKKNGGGNQTIYLQITRGCENERRLSLPENPTPTIFAYCHQLHTKSIEVMSQGVHAITLPDIRWHHCRTKAITLLANVLLNQEAKDKGVDDAILIRNGHAVEGPSSNVFIVKDGVISTPKLIPEILSGITRQLVLELALAEKMPCNQITIDEDCLQSADEIWLTGTSREISPVLELNGQPVGTGQAGPVWYKMIQLYQAYKQSMM